MKKTWVYFALIFLIVSCNEETSRVSNEDPSKIFKLSLNPTANADYHYDITNETVMDIEVDGKGIENTNKSDASVNYRISKDGIGSLLLTLQFEKIHIYTKNGKNIKELDSDNKLSSDPVIRLLGILKETTFQSTLNSNGESKIISGYKEFSDKIIEAFPATDEVTRNAIESQWNKTIGEKLVKQNTSQLFQVFPDTPVHVGSIWSTTDIQEGELPLTVENVFTLKSINDDRAIIKCAGTIASSNGQINISGIGNNVTTELKGEQEAEYEIETKTGMVINSKTKSDVSGTIQVMGRTIPLKIKTSIKVKGRKL